jgi:hypothetical protein
VSIETVEMLVLKLMGILLLVVQRALHN